LLEAILAFQLF